MDGLYGAHDISTMAPYPIYSRECTYNHPRFGCCLICWRK